MTECPHNQDTMKKMKHFILLLVTLSLALVTIPFSPVSANGTTISIGAPATVLEGETFTINVNVDAVTNLASWQYAIAYNPAVIRVVGADGGAEGVSAGLIGPRVIPVSTWNFSPSGTQGALIALQTVPVLQPVSGTGYLAQVHFQVLPGTAGLSSAINFVDLPGATPPFTRGMWNNLGSAISVSWVSSTVNVTSAPLTVSINTPATVTQGSDFVARANITQGTNLNAYQFQISYDPGVIQVTSVTAGLIGSTTMPVNMWAPALDTPGTIRALGNLPGLSSVTGAGYLAEIHFHVIGSPGQTSNIAFTAAPDFSNLLFNNMGSPITPVAWVGGTVNVASVPITVSIGAPATVLEGETFIVNVNIDAVTNLASWQYAIAYNPAVIRVIGAEGGAEGVTTGLINGTRALPVNMWIYSPTGSQGTVIALQALPVLQPVSGAGYLAQVHFQVLPGTSGLSSFINFVDLPGATPPFTRGMWDGTGNKLTGVNWSNGSVSVVASSPIIATSSPLPGGEVGVAYSQTLAASGGTLPYIWSIQPGALPAGLTLNPSTGAITGTPTTAGAFSVIVTVTDSFTPAISVSVPLALTIFLRGDVNGDGLVNMGDVTKVERIILGLDMATPGADANGDGLINMGDVTRIERIILGI
jgi:hypothetical protein